ncbi:glucose-6-phosphate 1-dehydrogenase, cytoplasmic, variant 2 [Cymbomonas tetramitiformis]|uniref:glucose-6-phosphate dehydrogenase (NADP(+)) n=1 Tax=Cymbomonas tetramitiformis TaxID=36881 RepID=A0AAE0BCC5_9CHLO|nr:glucose-6-phosphate 1-dehydrogenase, cytoplasmic, variant 2 [Cymbomonas tetramitiformis]
MGILELILDWFKQGSASLQGIFDHIKSHEEANADAKAHNRIFHFAVPYSVWPEVCQWLKEKNDEFPNNGCIRLVLEKPFGRDHQSVLELINTVDKYFKEDQVYRVDRYLGKEILENLLVMRFANRFFAPIWNRDTVNTVQILFKEPWGAEDQNRMQYFDLQGIVRDVIENHLLQVMALIAMDKPASLSVEDIRNEKIKLLRSVKAIRKEDVVIGQYTPGNGHPGYLEDPNILGKPSTTPTFAMMVVYIRNERWDGVPFILKAGKALNEMRSEIRIQLKSVPGDLFQGADLQRPNELVVRMQPTEEMYLKMTIKKPGLGMEIVPTEMEYSDSAKDMQDHSQAPHRAYERLLLNCMHGENRRMVHRDELLASYTVMDPVNKMVDNSAVPLHHYTFGCARAHSFDC